LIRDAIKAKPKMGNTDLAKMLNEAGERKSDKIKVTPQDVAMHRQAMKRAHAKKFPAAAAAQPAGNGRQKPGPKPGRKPAASPVDLIDKAFALA
jgi:hypothetical protein